MFWTTTPHHIVVQLLNFGDHWANSAVPNREVVDVAYRLNLGSGSADECFVGDVEFGPVNVTFQNRNAEIVPEQVDCNFAGYAFENSGADWRRDGDAVPDNEQAGV